MQNMCGTIALLVQKQILCLMKNLAFGGGVADFCEFLQIWPFPKPKFWKILNALFFL
jgi:hypothetical protein